MALDEKLYTAEWNFENPYDVTPIDGFDIPVSLPKKPPKTYFNNTNKAVSNQKFEREVIPKDLMRWPERLRDKFVERMYHKRRNGEWWMIKGKEVYLTGKYWFYLNFWWTESGMFPEFREGDMNFYLVWEHCCRDKNCYGMLDIKGRRMGDTEKALNLVWEKSTGTRYTWCGMQNVKEDDAKDNFIRIVHAHNKIPWFFKPIMKGSSAPTKDMEFDYPEEIYSRKKLKDKKKRGDIDSQGDLIHKFSPIQSRIDYETSVKGRYDGKRLAIWHLDEPGKITAFDVNEQWSIIKPALALQNGVKIIGKALWTTTVEDFESAKTMQNIQKTWNDSDPSNKNKNGRTKSGLYRYFRNCIYAFTVDEWGFHDKEACIEFVNNEKESFEQMTDWDGLADFMRKHPLSIEDVFKPPHNECVLFPALLDKRMTQIDTNKAGNGGDVSATGTHVKPLEIAGDFVWTGGFGGEVMWLPSKNGKWRVSHFPDKPNNFFKQADGLPRPGNDNQYTFGVDPIDHMAEKGEGSDGGGAIYRRYNEIVDGNLDMDEEGEVAEWDMWKMQTDRFVADYMDRPDNPYEYFEEMLKAGVYYGVPVFPEANRGSIIPWFYSKGFKHYIKGRPKETHIDQNKKKRKAFRKEKGIKANTAIIHLYTQELKKHVFSRWQTIHHKRIINDFRQYNVKNRTYRDLTVACGMALLAAMDMKKEAGAVVKKDWNGLPLKKRKRRI